MRGHALIGVVIVTALGILFYCSQWSSYPQVRWASPWQVTDKPSNGTCVVAALNKTAADDSLAAPVVLSVGSASRHSQAVNGNHKKVPEAARLELYTPPPLPCKTPSLVSQPSAATDMSHGPFIPESKNPCWWNSTVGNPASHQLHCFPYFFLAGVSKCGSTDIFARLSGHPQVFPPNTKEPRWFDWKRFAPENNTLTCYVSNFMQASWQILRDVSQYGMSDKIVGDGSPTYFWRNFHWAKYPGNEGCLEPVHLIPHTLRSLLPQTRVILSFRNPVNSIYSKYLSTRDKGAQCSPQEFHRLVEEEIGHYTLCFRRWSVRSCAYNITLSTRAKVRLEKGLYAVFLSDWFRVFPRRQFHIVRFEDYIQNIAGHLREMFRFLDLKPMADNDLCQLAALPAFNRGQHYSVGQMLPATRRLLQDFYAPFNAHLALMMNDQKYLWTDPG